MLIPWLQILSALLLFEAGLLPNPPFTPLDPPAFSHPAGFYTNGFELALESPRGRGTIRFTLDGSEPTPRSPAYTKPIHIDDRTAAPNRLSLIPTAPNFLPPLRRVFKATVVRARIFGDGDAASHSRTRTFFVHSQGRARYTVPVLSLATDAANLFDPTTGIYVPGITAEGNYSRRGAEWKRRAHIEFFETNGAVAFSREVQVKLHGNSSRVFPIKGLDLGAVKEKGEAAFHYRIFPDRAREQFGHILLRPSGHDHHLALMRDELMQSLAQETGAETQGARLAVLFINGEYWGLHYLKEKEDAEFVAYYGHTTRGNIDYLEDYITAKVGDARQYQAMMEFASTHDLNLPVHYTQLQTFLDLPNYIDYKATEVFNYRWDIGNHRLWRTRAPPGRWRWLQFDNDVGWGGFWAVQPAWEFDMLEAISSTSGSLYTHNDGIRTRLFRQLLKSDSFRHDFANRMADLLNSVFAPAHTVDRVNQFAAALQPEIAEHCARWRYPGSIGEWQRNVDALREFARRRPEQVRRQVIRNFGLSGTATLSLSVHPPGSGAIQVNSINVQPPSPASWIGTYFQGIPLAISAMPASGFRFQEWQGASWAGATSTNCLLRRDLSLTAVFVSDRGGSNAVLQQGERKD